MVYIGDSELGKFSVTNLAIRCLNPNCNMVTLSASLNIAERAYNSNQLIVKDLLYRWDLLPESKAKRQPEYIPLALREDYVEACKIRDLSPKAAATLARRCLQGMIRDFCDIRKRTLFDEIKKLREKIDEGNAPKGVSAETMDAIDAVKAIGNIGAHMEKEIDLIVEVDPGEAQSLIELIEMLFDEWYIARHERQERLTRIKSIAAEKAETLEKLKAERSTVAKEADDTKQGDDS